MHPHIGHTCLSRVLRGRVKGRRNDERRDSRKKTVHKTRAARMTYARPDAISLPSHVCPIFSSRRAAGQLTFPLRQFTINAMNIHHGMEASERFGVRWTGSHDFGESGVPDAVYEGDISALVAFQATQLPSQRPYRVNRNDR
jgi:hypothetical protein